MITERKYVEVNKLISEFEKQCNPDMVMSVMFHKMINSLAEEDTVKINMCKECKKCNQNG